jgi:hypothetical protein
MFVFNLVYGWQPADSHAKVMGLSRIILAALQQQFTHYPGCDVNVSSGSI